jgi:hypothetical protein
LGKSFEVSLLDELTGVFDELKAVVLDDFSLALENCTVLDESGSFDDELSLTRLLDDVFSLTRLLDDEF